MAPAEYHAFALVSKSFNVFFSAGDQALRSVYVNRVHGAIDRVVKLERPQEYSPISEIISRRLASLKFYQIASFIEQYDVLKNFGFRYFCRSWLDVCKIPFEAYHLKHPAVLILCSKLQPGCFWKYLTDFVSNSLAVAFPSTFFSMNQIEKKFLVRYYLNRGLPIKAYIPVTDEADTPFFRSVRAAANMYARFPREFDEALKGHWDSIGSLLYRYETYTQCHFPLPCQLVGCVEASSYSIGWLPRTELFTSDGYFVDEIGL